MWSRGPKGIRDGPRSSALVFSTKGSKRAGPDRIAIPIIN